jgi:hypothetical protein
MVGFDADGLGDEHKSEQEAEHKSVFGHGLTAVVPQEFSTETANA